MAASFSSCKPSGFQCGAFHLELFAIFAFIMLCSHCVMPCQKQLLLPMHGAINSIDLHRFQVKVLPINILLAAVVLMVRCVESAEMANSLIEVISSQVRDTCIKAPMKKVLISENVLLG